MVFHNKMDIFLMVLDMVLNIVLILFWIILGMFWNWCPFPRSFSHPRIWFLANCIKIVIASYFSSRYPESGFQQKPHFICDFFYEFDMILAGCPFPRSLSNPRIWFLAKLVSKSLKKVNGIKVPCRICFLAKNSRNLCFFFQFEPNLAVLPFPRSLFSP